MKHHDAAGTLSASSDGVHQGLEFRHLRYLVAVADAGTFTHAAERMFLAQPTLSQQIRRLEEMVGTPLLQRRRDGVRLTAAGSILLEESRAVLSRLEHGISRSRQAAGLGRPRLRFVLPAGLPDELTVAVASRLRSAATAAEADVEWLETPLDAEFSTIQQRQADACLGWLTSPADALPASLDAMSLGTFEPETWLPVSAGVAPRASIGVDDLARMPVMHGPRRSGPAIYDAWLAVLRDSQPTFAFTDPPVRHSLPMTLALAATAGRPTAVLTGPLRNTPGANTPGSDTPGPDTPGPDTPGPDTPSSYDMVRVHLDQRPLTATAAVVWHADLPRGLQQVLFDTADIADLASASAW
jgi:DNA-binding transcriptional LysR family regulator